VQVLAEQIEQAASSRSHGVNGDAQIESLQATATGVAVGKRLAHVD
jgi:hypothetical protein